MNPVFNILVKKNNTLETGFVLSLVKFQVWTKYSLSDYVCDT